MKRKIVSIVIIILIAVNLCAQTYNSQWSINWEDYHKKKQKIGLALGGGSVLGAAHIGVLKAIHEMGIEIDYITGTSIGAFVAGLYASGLDLQEIEQITEDLNWLDLSAPSLSRLGLLSNKRMGDLIRDKIGEIKLEETKIPVAMIAVDIETMEKVVLNKGEVARASMASTCVPGVFVPVDIDGRMLVDGGVTENVPVSPLVDMGAELIIAVDLRSKHKNKRPKSLTEILLRTFAMTSATATKYQKVSADIIIAPNLSDFNVVDIDQAPELIEVGYKEAKKVLSEYFIEISK